MSDPRIDSYEWAGGREPMLRFGPQDGPVVVLALPLFEEANRCRAFGVSILRGLAAHGIGSVLPELPGQGESLIATEDATLDGLRSALGATPGSYVAAIRSGALLVDRRACWMLAPQAGTTLLRELSRVKGAPLEGERVEVAGNILSKGLIDSLAHAPHPGEGRGGCRVVRLATDPGAADRHIDGPAIWRRSEPGNDPALAQALAADIADWIAKSAA